MSALRGQPVWKPDRIHGSMFFLEIGKPVREPGDRRDHGEWILTVQMADWCFRTKDTCLIYSEAEQPTVDAVFADLPTGGLGPVQVEAAIGMLILDVGNGISLDVTPVTEAEYRTHDQWSFSGPDTEGWVARGQGVEYY